MTKVYCENCKEWMVKSGNICKSCKKPIKVCTTEFDIHTTSGTKWLSPKNGKLPDKCNGTSCDKCRMI